MTDPARDLEAQALKLPTRARALLVRRLISSLDEEADPDNERLWIDESERRLEELKSAAVTGIPADRVFAEVRSKLR
jgi:putative addiction module component (TIGR02574 family)